jgi:hypothetical protein
LANGSLHRGIVFWNYDPAGLPQQPRDEIDVYLDDGELADVQDLVD